MSSKKEKIVEIEETDLNKLEDLVWILDEFADLNLIKCITIEQLLIWNFNLKIREDLVLLTGDHFSCSIRVNGLIDKDGEIAEICEKYIKNKILWYAMFKGWIDVSDY